MKAWSSIAPVSRRVRSRRLSPARSQSQSPCPHCIPRVPRHAEMDELTTTLFEEAHEMVAVEKAKRAAADKRYAEAKHKVDVRLVSRGK